MNEEPFTKLASVNPGRWLLTLVMLLAALLLVPPDGQKNALFVADKQLERNNLRVCSPQKQRSTHLKSKENDYGLYHLIIVRAASQHEVDPALVKAIIMAESAYDPRAISKKGAMGLMQLMPATAKALGVADTFNPEDNVNGGVKYFKQQLNQFNGDIIMALAAYNAGSTRVKRCKGIPPIKATQRYVKKVLEYYQSYKKKTV